MTQTNQEKLDEMYELVQENNEILNSLLRRQKVANFFRILYWFVILGGLLGAYYFIQPYVQILANNFTVAQQALDKLNGVTSSMPEINAIKNLLDALPFFKK